MATARLFLVRILVVARGFRDPFDVGVEAYGNLVLADRGPRAVVRVNPLSNNRTIVCDADTGSMRETKIRQKI